MDKFEAAFAYVMEREQGLSERESDPGGITKYGISLRFLKALALNNDMRKFGILAATIDGDVIRELTVDQAKAIYLNEFWVPAAFERINNQDACNYIFDMAVNMGIAPAIKCAQRACWAIFRERNIIADDGILGEKTLSLINEAEDCLIHAMRSERAGYYRLVAEGTPALKEYIDGWLNRAYGSEK